METANHSQEVNQKEFKETKAKYNKLKKKYRYLREVSTHYQSAVV